jgi:urease accessory protein
VLDACREVPVGDGARTGVTALPDVFAARYLGHSAEQAKSYFAALWAILRPWYAHRPAHRPRLWDT